MSNSNRQFFLWCLISVVWSVPVGVFAESEGALLFGRNHPHEAIVLFERDRSAGTMAPEDFNFLGLAYYQTGDYEKSLEAFVAGLAVSGTNKRILAYNAGNTASAAGALETAETYYTLALTADPAFKEALLNRANARLQRNDLYGALEDYRSFVVCAPDDAVTPAVQEIASALSREIQRREEEERMAAALERAARDEAARRLTEMIPDDAPPVVEAFSVREAVTAEMVPADALFSEPLPAVSVHEFEKIVVSELPVLPDDGVIEEAGIPVTVPAAAPAALFERVPDAVSLPRDASGSVPRRLSPERITEADADDPALYDVHPRDETLPPEQVHDDFSVPTPPDDGQDGSESVLPKPDGTASESTAAAASVEL